MTSDAPETWKLAFRHEMYEQAVAAVNAFSEMGVRAPVPWPVPSDVTRRKGVRSDYFIALWRVSADAVDFSAAKLSAENHERARVSVERLRLIALAFRDLEKALSAPNEENLAALFFTGARLRDAAGAASTPMAAPKRKRGRPPGSRYAKTDWPLVKEARRRMIFFEEKPSSAWRAVAERAAGPITTLESKIRRLKRLHRSALAASDK
jgi:hypothetical protein